MSAGHQGLSGDVEGWRNDWSACGPIMSVVLLDLGSLSPNVDSGADGFVESACFPKPGRALYAPGPGTMPSPPMALNRASFWNSSASTERIVPDCCPTPFITLYAPGPGPWGGGGRRYARLQRVHNLSDREIGCARY